MRPHSSNGENEVELNLIFRYILRVIFRSGMGRVRNDPQKHEGQALLVCAMYTYRGV